MNQIVILVFCALVAFAHPAAAQSVKIGYVDTLRIEHESQRAQRMIRNLKGEFATREQALRDLQSQVTAMQSALNGLDPATPDAEKDSKQREFAALGQRFDQARRSFTEDLDRRKAEERQKFFQEIGKAVDKVAKEQNFDLVLQEAVYAAPAIDITSQVLTVLDGGAQSQGDAGK